MAFTRIDVEPVTGALGAELTGIDLSRPLDDATFAEIQRAFDDYQVIFFRDQDLTPPQQRDFALRFGPAQDYPFVVGLEGCPEVIEIVKEPDEKMNFGGAWHSDTTYMARPPLGTLLYAREVPPAGGDTLFANTYLAYETLSDGLKAMLAPLTGVNSASLRGNSGVRYGHSSMTGKGRNETEMEALHPVIRTHPRTGRKSLYVNAIHTARFDGMSDAESRPLIEYLSRHATRPEFTCRFRWRRGSIAFWDNRCTQHFAVNDYDGQRRVMHRVTIEGEVPA